MLLTPLVSKPLVTIGPTSSESIGLEILGRMGVPSPASATFPAANLAFFIPFTVMYPMTAVKMAAYNGANVTTSNIDVGIYIPDPGAATATLLVSSGTTTQAGLNANQTFDITDTMLGAGVYYLAVSMDNATAALFRYTFGALGYVVLGCAQMATAFPLPATATLVALANDYIPAVFVTTRALV